ncbi:MAG: hypothetical protein KAS73_00905 [Candidatus Sabulitectum sp.]|nr:hypothetical protein [Candidatus Sabulitectum sp.]
MIDTKGRKQIEIGSTPSDNQFEQLMDKLRQVVIALLHHGFFDVGMECEIVKSNRREVIIDAGKKYKFNIPFDEVPEMKET